MSGRQDTLFRYLAMLQLIPRAPHYRATTTLQALLEERGFKVELRSIQRDLEKMSAHFPLLCDRSQRPYRWSFDREFKSNLPALDTATALTLVLAEQYLSGLLPQIAIDQLSGQFEAARKYLDGINDNRLAHWSRFVKAIPNGKALIPVLIEHDTWQIVTDALLNRYALDVEYRSRSKDEHKAFTLHPLGIVARHSMSYLLATVNGYDDVRQFALHRILSITPSEQPYRAQPEFCVDDYISTGAFGYPLDEQSVQLKARIRPEVAWLLSETPLSDVQRLTDEPDEQGWCWLEAEVPNDQQTQWWIQGFGSAIDVVEPQSWREAIHRQAREVLGGEA
ncbi:helix-turn-helix transcriptional regulator [Marinobacterium sediminicola]|uniref:Predicted DNA-binding transcriptional regulator YafY, contains an HTH and WYL domains n=1 Tax=Marinobacterium sediminicola TaxID=518898 RepID=A0ABY1S224_9GAMM|nr:WYL domain-containing protein [Marinobacterium sediminicola]ULG68537.1 WYL domain-containing protein [Marinobacterium sediminicola]SMR76613.1 Predicted DNA-binding transcriptional regulator YafY, contains an HTH and WYL domains [Marinobacterium sediminicola]